MKRNLKPDELADQWIAERLAIEPDAAEVEVVKSVKLCRCPNCPRRGSTRELCMKHRARAFRLIECGGVTEGFLVLHGRMAPARGRTLADYVDSAPGPLPSRHPDTLWLFGLDVADNREQAK